MKSEKRKNSRLLVKDGAYAALGDHFDKVGKLIDISPSGLAFRYIDNIEDVTHDHSTVAIFVSKNDFYLPDLACRSVYNLPLHSNNNIQSYKTQIKMIRCGLKFISLSEHQRDRLDSFIKQYT